MSKVITFSRFFQKNHPKNGQPTFFIEKIWAFLAEKIDGFKIPNHCVDWDWHEYYNAIPKLHTIRKGKRWKVGDKFSPRYWSGKPYKSKQVIFANDIEIKKIFDIDVDEVGVISINGFYLFPEEMGGKDPQDKLARNDGLSTDDFLEWIVMPCFRKGESFSGQIICFTENIQYP